VSPSVNMSRVMLSSHRCVICLNTPLPRWWLVASPKLLTVNVHTLGLPHMCAAPSMCVMISVVMPLGSGLIGSCESESSGWSRIPTAAHLDFALLTSPASSARP
jgi:hypothetical protein